jgi:diguanylate cyclase (GGDEF)-like protein
VSALVAVIGLSRVLDPGFPGDSLLLVTFYTYLLAGLPIKVALICGWGVLLLLLAVTLALPVKPPLVAYEFYYLVGGNLFGLVMRYLIEHRYRTSYLLARELAYHAQLDPLTEVLNRRAFFHRLARVWAQGQREQVPVGLMIVDLDHFKAINDRHGHLAGDRALKETAAACRAMARRPLDAVGRFGGDEFVAVLYDVAPDGFAALQASLVERLRAFRNDDLPGVEGIVISGGAVIERPLQAEGFRAALQRADANLYRVKHDRAACVLLTSTLPDESLKAAA